MIAQSLIRCALCGLVLAGLSAGFARAGDQAERRILGFSPDGSLFAFEQFGVQDGSGYPYANIFVIDTASDSWVKGTPFGAFLDDDGATLAQARDEVQKQAAKLLQKRGISQPGRLLASNPPQEVSADPHKAVVNAEPDPIAPPELWTFSIREKNFKNSLCTAFASDDQKGFTLTMQGQGRPLRTLHEDTSIPEGRTCAVGYGISDVLIHDPKGGKRVFAILISVFKHGFEGPDRRFLAVTAQVP